MKKCYACGGKVTSHEAVKEGVTLKGERCGKCGEEFYGIGELMRFEALTGRARTRTFGKLGASTIVRFPEDIVDGLKIKPGDRAVFETRKDGVLIRVVKA